MALKGKYPTAFPVIATYDFTDIITGTANLRLLGFSHKETTTEAFAISRQAIRSHSVVSNTTGGNTNGFTKKIDEDYDIRIEEPISIRGTARAIFTMGGDADAGVSPDIYMIVRIRKFSTTDTPNETEIASAQSQTFDVVPAVVISLETNMEITVPETHFNKGETLRITMELWSDEFGGGASRTIGYGRDPSERNDPNGTQVIEDADTTLLQWDIPIKTDL